MPIVRHAHVHKYKHPFTCNEKEELSQSFHADSWIPWLSTALVVASLASVMRVRQLMENINMHPSHSVLNDPQSGVVRISGDVCLAPLTSPPQGPPPGLLYIPDRYSSSIPGTPSGGEPLPDRSSPSIPGLPPVAPLLPPIYRADAIPTSPELLQSSPYITDTCRPTIM